MIEGHDAEAVAVRTVAAVLAEEVVRARTTPILLVLGVGGVVLLVAAATQDGLASVVLAAVGVLALLAAAGGVGFRAAFLAVVRRFAGGRHYPVVAPIVRRHLDAFRDQAQHDLSVFRLLLLVRRPARLKERLLGLGESAGRAAPELLAEVRAALGPPPARG